MSCKHDKPELEYRPQKWIVESDWIPDMLHTHGYGEVVIQDRVELAAFSVLSEMKKRGLLAEDADARLLAKGLGQAAGMKVAFYWHDKKPPHEHVADREKEEG